MSLDFFALRCLSVSVDPETISALIRNAFRDVKPGKVGIRQAQAMDDRLEGADLSKAAIQDRERRWTEISNQVIKENQYVWSYVDDDGFKFLLPVVMLWSMESDLNREEWIVESLFYNLVSESRDPKTAPEALIKRLQLDASQTAAIYAWLKLYCSHYPDSLTPIELKHLEAWSI